MDHVETARAPVTPDDPERRWLREVYQGDDARQLTLRAAVLGMLLGGVMSFSNLVISLKTGWSFGVTSFHSSGVATGAPG